MDRDDYLFENVIVKESRPLTTMLLPVSMMLFPTFLMFLFRDALLEHEVVLNIVCTVFAIGLVSFFSNVWKCVRTKFVITDEKLWLIYSSECYAINIEDIEDIKISYPSTMLETSSIKVKTKTGYIYLTDSISSPDDFVEILQDARKSLMSRQDIGINTARQQTG